MGGVNITMLYFDDTGFLQVNGHTIFYKPPVSTPPPHMGLNLDLSPYINTADGQTNTFKLYAGDVYGSCYGASMDILMEPLRPDLVAAVSPDPVPQQTVTVPFGLALRTSNPGWADSPPTVTRVLFNGAPVGNFNIPALAHNGYVDTNLPLDCPHNGSISLQLYADYGNAAVEGSGESNNYREIMVECIARPDLVPSAAPSVQTFGTPFSVGVITTNAGQAATGSPSVTHVEFNGHPAGDLSVSALAVGASSSSPTPQLSCPHNGLIPLQLYADSGGAVNEGPFEANNYVEYMVECKPSQLICGTIDIMQTQTIALIGIIGAIMIIAMVYAAGVIWTNARLLMWAKAEVVQAIVSILLLVMIVWILERACLTTPGEIIKIFFG
jgi:hypothetical protein